MVEDNIIRAKEAEGMIPIRIRTKDILVPFPVSDLVISNQNHFQKQFSLCRTK